MLSNVLGIYGSTSHSPNAHDITVICLFQLKSYVDEWYTGRRMTVVGVGVNHDELVKHAEASLGGVPEGMTTTDEQCEYVGGNSMP